jgi:hypothetical protein
MVVEAVRPPEIGGVRAGGAADTRTGRRDWGRY